MRSIAPFIQRKVVVLHQDDTLQSAAKAMREHRIGFLVISNHKGQIVGVITDRDLVAQGLADGKSSDARIADCMTRLPVMVEEKADLDQVIDRMQEFGVRRVPVVERRRGDTLHCVGVVCLDDLIIARAIDSTALSRIVRMQLKRQLLGSVQVRGVSASAEKFMEHVASHLETKAEFSRSELEQLTFTVVGAIARRLHHTGALQLIHLLPPALQPALIALPAGPDDSIQLNRLIHEVARGFEMDDALASTLITRFGAALEEWCDTHFGARSLGHIKAQLTEDLRSIFPQVQAPAARPGRAA